MTFQPLHEENRDHQFEIHAAVLAERVEVLPNGNLNIFGVFNAISAGGFPAEFAALAVLVRLQYGLSHASDAPVPVKLRFTDLDGSLHEIRLEISLPKPDTGVWAISNNIFNLPNFPIQAAGEYTFEFWIGGSRLCALPLVARLVTAGQSAADSGTADVPAT